MKKYIIGFVVGSLIVGVLSIFAIRSEQKRWFDLGHNNGVVTGVAQATRAIREEFGTYEGAEETRTLFIAKPHPVVSVTIDGVKTIRVID